MGRPDGAIDVLGVAVVDEPATNQSDATVLDLQLRAMSKVGGAGREPALVHSIENAHRMPREVRVCAHTRAYIHARCMYLNHGTI